MGLIYISKNDSVKETLLELGQGQDLLVRELPAWRDQHQLVIVIVQPPDDRDALALETLYWLEDPQDIGIQRFAVRRNGPRDVAVIDRVEEAMLRMARAHRPVDFCCQGFTNICQYIHFSKSDTRYRKCYNRFMLPQILIDHLPSILKEFPGISLVYLFGSQVTGQIGPMSDYDLAILDASAEDEFLTQVEFQHALVKVLETERVDVVLLDRAPVELAYQIISSGKLLYQKDAYTKVEFEAQVLGEYGDYLPTLRFFSDHILQGNVHAKRVQRYREALGRTQRTLGEIRTAPRSKAR